MLKIAQPIANDETLRVINEVLEEIEKPITGVKACQKAICNREKGVLVLTGDTTPMDLIMHLPALCEEHSVKYVFVETKKQLKGEVTCVFIKKEGEDKMDTPVDDESEKKPYQVIFGKEFRKTYISSPCHIGIPVDQLPNKYRTKHKLESLIKKLIKNKYYVAKPDDSTSKDVLDIVKLEIDQFVSFDVFFTLLDYLIHQISPLDVKMIYISLINNYEAIINSSLIQDFLNSNLEIIPSVNYDEIPKTFIEKFMYKDSGILLATSLIINNNVLASYFYYYITINDPGFLNSDYIWMFLAVLVSLVDDDKKFKLVEITRDKIFNLKNTNLDKFEKTEIFLRAIGVTKEDIL
ncbi:hypothetical protein evm_015133 [Chilo suppressalis]|nr:hypothetical protein evm_015133 [Chilo suppressalis]